MKPLLLVKYIDHILAIIKRDEVEKLLESLSQVHPRIKLSVEKEERSKIHFFDMSLTRISNVVYKNWYSKEMASQIMLNFKSRHPLDEFLMQLKIS